MTTTRYLFFTGKGGVGKTSAACATAIRLADAGKKVLLVSTDPASNLDDVLETTVRQEPTPIPGAPRLWALNLDPEEAARSYRERVVGPYRQLLPAEAVAAMEEQLSGGCTLEIATFDLFTRLLTDPDQVGPYDHIIFDTAPTGHTLRLLALPKSWSGFLGNNSHGTTCIGPAAGLEENRRRYEDAVAALANPALTTLILVTRPERPAVWEAARASRELAELGIGRQSLIVNGVLKNAGEDVVARTFKQQQEEALAALPAELKELPCQVLPLLPLPPVGVARVRDLTAYLGQPAGRPTAPVARTREHPQPEAAVSANERATIGIPSGLEPVLADISRHGKGVLLVMGKGGVGKTTIAAALALGLAQQGQRVHLSTTDPAAHLDLALAGASAHEKGLTVSHIDPQAEVIAYREQVMATAGANLDAEGRALLAEDLASPCTEEIAVFRAFARTVAEAAEGFVVLDTAPTGHTLLLLDATQAYHREVERNTGEVPEEVRLLLPRLRDPGLTHVLLVTLAQATPVLEAARLQADLRRAGIEPAWWVINQTWTGAATSHPVLRSLAQAEQPWFARVTKTLARKTVFIPWLAEAPRGEHGLAQLFSALPTPPARRN